MSLFTNTLRCALPIVISSKPTIKPPVDHDAPSITAGIPTDSFQKFNSLQPLSVAIDRRHIQATVPHLTPALLEDKRQDIRFDFNLSATQQAASVCELFKAFPNLITPKLVADEHADICHDRRLNPAQRNAAVSQLLAALPTPQAHLDE